MSFGSSVVGSIKWTFAATCPAGFRWRSPTRFSDPWLAPTTVEGMNSSGDVVAILYSRSQEDSMEEKLDAEEREVS